MMLSLDTAYRSFGGEVEASSTPTICRLSDSPRHQLSAIALGRTGSTCEYGRFSGFGGTGKLTSEKGESQSQRSLRSKVTSSLGASRHDRTPCNGAHTDQPGGAAVI